jgi:hypothetical protein
MNKPLNADMERCYGVGCAQKENCKRFLTMRIDAEYGQRLLSYTSSLVLDDGSCDDFLEDKNG